MTSNDKLRVSVSDHGRETGTVLGSRILSLHIITSLVNSVTFVFEHGFSQIYAGFRGPSRFSGLNQGHHYNHRNHHDHHDHNDHNNHHDDHDHDDHDHDDHHNRRDHDDHDPGVETQDAYFSSTNPKNQKRGLIESTKMVVYSSHGGDVGYNMGYFDILHACRQTDRHYWPTISDDVSQNVFPQDISMHWETLWENIGFEGALSVDHSRGRKWLLTH